jgi:hypothetical protein
MTTKKISVQFHPYPGCYDCGAEYVFDYNDMCGYCKFDFEVDGWIFTSIELDEKTYKFHKNLPQEQKKILRKEAHTERIEDIKDMIKEKREQFMAQIKPDLTEKTLWNHHNNFFT